MAGTEVPTELVSVTETDCRTPVSPEIVNGTVSRNILPLDWPSALLNHVENSELRGTVKVAGPVNCVPEAAVKVKFALVMSRVVE